VASRPYPDRRRGVWRCKYKPDPAGPWVSVILGRDERLKGARPPKSPPDPVRWAAQELAEVERRARLGLGAPPPQVRDLATHLHAYLAAYPASHDEGSVRQLARHVARFLAFCESRKVASLQAVTRAVCREYLLSRVASVSHNSLRTEVRYLSPIWSQALTDGLVAANPWSRIAVPGKPTEHAATCWSDAEVAAIATAAGTCKAHWRDLVLVLANTGLRISTCLAMEWRWVDGGTLRIPAEAGEDDIKTSYSLILSDAALEVLARRRAAVPSGRWVWPNPLRPGQPIRYEAARSAIQRAIRLAGVKHGTPHDLRHTYARALAAAGVPLNRVQAQLGHASLATTQRYLDVSDSTDAPQVQAFGLGVSGDDG
jgi:site-specific recombinase XerD